MGGHHDTYERINTFKRILKRVSVGGEDALWEPVGVYDKYDEPIWYEDDFEIIHVDNSTPFNGVFDGNGHMISGLYIDSDSDYQGLFGRIDGGVVQDLTVDGTVKGDEYIGGIVGFIGLESSLIN